MTIELHLPVFETLRIDACCRAAGLDFAAILARYANIITGARPADTAPAAATPAVAAEEEEPAVICPPPRVPLPVPVPPSLRGPGEPIPDPGNIDWDDPETYR